MTTLAEGLASTARQHADRPALRWGRQTWTYAGFTERVRRTAGLLASSGVGPGTRVGLVVPNVPAFPVLFYGALWAGATAVPMNPLIGDAELAHQVDDASMAMLVALHGFDTAARAVGHRTGAEVLVVAAPGPDDRQLRSGGTLGSRPVAVSDQDDAVLHYSAGTGGITRAARLSHANLHANATACAETLLDSGPDDVLMCCLPMFHAFGLTCGLNAAVLSGACVALLPRFDPRRALAMVEHHRVSIFEGLPAMFSGMLGVPLGERARTEDLRVCLSGGSTLPAGLMRSFEREFSTIVLEGYGRPETSPLVSFNHPHAERRPGSIGTPVRGVEMRLVDVDGHAVRTDVDEVGEIAVRGDGLMTGYWGAPGATAAAVPDGWFRTGDLARRDDDGYYYLVDRKASLIVRGGYHVYPHEIEEALREHPAVADVAVVGLPHPALGQEVGAAVALIPEASVTAEELQDHVRARVAAYRFPRRIWFVDRLPTDPTGKVLRDEVRPPCRRR